jgi:hypothetical protein
MTGSKVDAADIAGVGATGWAAADSDAVVAVVELALMHAHAVRVGVVFGELG